MHRNFRKDLLKRTDERKMGLLPFLCDVLCYNLFVWNKRKLSLFCIRPQDQWRAQTPNYKFFSPSSYDTSIIPQIVFLPCSILQYVLEDSCLYFIYFCWWWKLFVWFLVLVAFKRSKKDKTFASVFKVKLTFIYGWYHRWMQGPTTTVKSLEYLIYQGKMLVFITRCTL